MHRQASLRKSAGTNSRAAQKEDTRRRLLAAARSQFRSRGVEPVSMEDVANAARVSRATVYLHFPGKPALLEALLEEDWEGQVRLFERFCTVDLLHPDELDRWVMHVAEGMVKARDSFAIHRAALGHNPEMTERHQRHRRRLAKILGAAAHGHSAELVIDVRRSVEAELIVAELEYFATSVALGWTEDEVAAGAELIECRLREFAPTAG